MIILACIICAVLGAVAGSRNTPKAIRRIGIPVVIILALMLKYGFSYYHFLPILTHIALRLGYGIPDATDKGSDIGRFWSRLISNRIFLNMATRGTVGFLGALPLFFLAGPIVLVIPFCYVLFGAIIPGEPVIRFGKYEILVEDILIYWAYGLGVV